MTSQYKIISFPVVMPHGSSHRRRLYHGSQIYSSPYLAQAGTWELDFCSRPIVDSRDKKIWELLLTDTNGSFIISKSFPNTKINSVNLRTALEKILIIVGLNRPARCKFFRGQMQTIISRALSDIGIKPVPTRRCFTMDRLLEERFEPIYKQHPRYKENFRVFDSELSPLQDLPDELRGERWAFVQSSASELLEEAQDVEEEKIFGSTSVIRDLLRNVTPETLIPGVAVLSNRAIALAAWTSGLELAAVTGDVERACLILETGIDQRWRYASYPTSDKADQEAQAWERAKMFADGYHFLAIQTDLDSEELAGIWLMQTRKAPRI